MNSLLKKSLVGFGLIVLASTVIFGLPNFIEPQSQEVDKYKIILEELNGLNNYSYCSTDSDCKLFSPQCDDCHYVSVNNDSLNNLREQKHSYCQVNPPRIMCDLAFAGEIKCINSSCQIAGS